MNGHIQLKIFYDLQNTEEMRKVTSYKIIKSVHFMLHISIKSFKAHILAKGQQQLFANLLTSFKNKTRSTENNNNNTRKYSTSIKLLWLEAKLLNSPCL